MIKRASIAVFITVFLTACVGTAGTDFKKIEINQLTYGSDTPETIKQKLGEPSNEGTVTENGKQFKTMHFDYASTGGSAAYEGVIATRIQGFFFFQNKLVGQLYTSSWAIDSTDFDESKVREIKEGSTTIQEVIDLLGGPAGEQVYPLVKGANEQAKIYSYHQTTGSIFSGFKNYRKSLVVTHDENGIVTEVVYASMGEKTGSIKPSQPIPAVETWALGYTGQAEEEINTQTYDQNLWDKALVETGGDEAKRRSRYIELRVKQLYIAQIDLSGTYTSAITYKQDVDRSRMPSHFGKRPNIVIDIQQKDEVITGVMSGDRSGEIGGLIEGNKITFNYYMKVPGNSDKEGHGTWMIGDDRSTLNGTWRGNAPYNSYAGEWNLTKIE